MVEYHLHGSKPVQPSLQVTKLSMVDLTVLGEYIKRALETTFPVESFVQMAHTECYSGTSSPLEWSWHMVQQVVCQIIFRVDSDSCCKWKGWFLCEIFKCILEVMSLEAQEVFKWSGKVRCLTSFQWQHTLFQGSIWRPRSASFMYHRWQSGHYTLWFV